MLSHAKKCWLLFLSRRLAYLTLVVEVGLFALH